MTKDEFEKGYAERSGVTVEWLHSMGQWAIPCDCGDEGCHGWQMAHLTPAAPVRAELVRCRDCGGEIVAACVNCDLGKPPCG